MPPRSARGSNAGSASRTTKTSRRGTSSRPTRSKSSPEPSEPAVLVALERFDLRIPGCRSLKEKRHVVKSLTGALRSRFEVSVAEVDYLDLWQRTAIGVAVVGAEGHHVRSVMHRIEAF